MVRPRNHTDPATIDPATIEKITELLRLSKEANFFMAPPLDLFIEMEEEQQMEEPEEDASLLNKGVFGLQNVGKSIHKPTLLRDNVSKLEIFPDISCNHLNWIPGGKIFIGG